MLKLRPASSSDLPVLARMNKGLIEDEGSRNPMSLEQLEARMQGWLESETWKIELLVQGEKIVGYILYRPEQDEYFPQQKVYLRQFYVLPDCRRQGLGRAAVKHFLNQWPQGTRIVLEVLTSNAVGKAFWQCLGFTEYAVALEYQI